MNESELRPTLALERIAAAFERIAAAFDRVYPAYVYSVPSSGTPFPYVPPSTPTWPNTTGPSYPTVTCKGAAYSGTLPSRFEEPNGDTSILPCVDRGAESR
jgi:hypothetical protein